MQPLQNHWNSGRISAESIAAGVKTRERMEVWAVQFSLNVGTDADAARRLVDQAFDAIHARLKPFISSKAWRLASTTSDPSTTFRDLCSVASMSIFTNLKRWHPSQNRRFSMTAMRTHVNSEMVRCLNEEIRLIYYPEQLVKNIIDLNKAATRGEEAADEFLNTEGSSWSKRRRESVQHFRHALLPNSASEVLEDDFQDDQSSANRHGFRIIGETQEKGMGDEATLLSTIMEDLADHESRTLKMYFGMGEFAGDAHTYARIGEIEGITREGARQRVIIAVGKLKKRLARKGINKLTDVLS